MKISRSLWGIIVISALALFLEMVIIRWLACEIRIFAYFKNLPLMAAFLGFGIGFFLYQKADSLFRWFPPLVTYLVLVIAGARGLGITHVIFVDPRQYFLLGAGFGDHAPDPIPSVLQTIKALVVIIIVFFLVVAVFATLTARIGAMLNRERPLPGYSANVAGSLLGIVAFSGVSYLHWPPALWLACCLLPLLGFYPGGYRKPLLYFSGGIGATVLLSWVHPAIWSPYYRIEAITLENDPVDVELRVNYDGFQAIQDLSPGHLSQFKLEQQGVLNRHYNVPYQVSTRQIRTVLVLGGGAGNDAAAALRNGADRVDVVEIDPVIVQIGRQLHPEKPYASSRVRVFVDDARSFLQKNRHTYDLIVFATLDSHTVFSSLSSLRLDNFVFTRESVVSAMQRLNPGGGIAINFFATKPWLSQRHVDTLEAATGRTPFAFASPSNQEVILLSGECFDPGKDPGTTDYHRIPVEFMATSVEATTDDWPFLFLESRGIPFHYLLPLMVILILSFLPLIKFDISAHQIHWQLFFMGAGFLLVETKAVTTLALIFGSTWMVNSIVVGAVLCTILLANLLVGRFSSLSFTALYLGLLACLLFNFAFSFDTLNQLSWTYRLTASSLIVSSPIFFAALIFARSFASVPSPSLALASNLFGSLLGGLLEYLDMWTGLRWLNLLALLLYFSSALFLAAKKEFHPQPSPASGRS
ncbi:MAG: hypothetical protein AB1898_24080 [Acidobacteriota bacterium]